MGLQILYVLVYTFVNLSNNVREQNNKICNFDYGFLSFFNSVNVCFINFEALFLVTFK